MVIGLLKLEGIQKIKPTSDTLFQHVLIAWSCILK